MNIGYIAAFATIICWTISTFVLAKLTRLVTPDVLNRALLFFGIFLLGLTVCIVDRFPPWRLITLPNASNWLWLGLSGILGKSIGDYCGLNAVRILGARRRTMITTLGPAFTWLFGLIFLNEAVNWLGIFAILFTIASLLLLINSSAEKQEVIDDRFGRPIPGFLYAIAGTALTVLAIIFSKVTLDSPGNGISAFHAIWIRVLTAFLAILVVDIARMKKLTFISEFSASREKAVLLFYSILFGSVFGLSLFLMAAVRLTTAVAFTIISLLPVAVILVSAVVHKKKITLQSCFYSVTAITGMLVLIWRNELLKWLSVE